MIKKIKVIILAIIFGLVGSYVSYFINIEKVGQVNTDLRVEYLYTGSNFFPFHIESSKMDSHILDNFVSKSSQSIASEYWKLYKKYTDIHQIHYERKNQKLHVFSRLSSSSDSNKKILNDFYLEASNTSTAKFITDLDRNIKDLSEFHKKKNCEEAMNEANLNIKVKETLLMAESLIDEFRGLVVNRKRIQHEDYIATTFLINEAFNSLSNRTNLFRNKIIICNENFKKLAQEKFLKDNLEELLTHNISWVEEKIIQSSKFIIFKGFVNGIIFFIFLKLSIMYFRES